MRVGWREGEREKGERGIEEQMRLSRSLSYLLTVLPLLISPIFSLPQFIYYIPLNLPPFLTVPHHLHSSSQYWKGRREIR